MMMMIDDDSDRERKETRTINNNNNQSNQSTNQHKSRSKSLTKISKYERELIIYACVASLPQKRGRDETQACIKKVV
jgi:hypothetical protein